MSFDFEKWLDKTIPPLINMKTGKPHPNDPRRETAMMFSPLIEAARLVDAAWLNGEGSQTGNFAGEMQGLHTTLRDLGVIDD